ncbi:MAG: helix-turn-helix domain-containing protein [Pseudomonadota bacterium]
MNKVTKLIYPHRSDEGETTKKASNDAICPVAQCSTCRLHTLCLPGAVADTQSHYVDQIVRSRRKVKRGETLYGLNSTFRSLYAVRNGFFKTSMSMPDGREQITGFTMSADTMGFDGIETDRHTLEVVALEDGEVCVIPFAHLQIMAEYVPGLLQQLHKTMSREIVRDQRVLLLLGSLRAEERVAAFLLNISQRLSARGYAVHEFHLRMTREEIGSYLSLKLETVSRILSQFQKNNLIDIQNRHVRLLDIERLQTIGVRDHDIS